MCVCVSVWVWTCMYTDIKFCRERDLEFESFLSHSSCMHLVNSTILKTTISTSLKKDDDRYFKALQNILPTNIFCTGTSSHWHAKATHMHLFSTPVQWHHTDSLKADLVVVFTPWKPPRHITSLCLEAVFMAHNWMAYYMYTMNSSSVIIIKPFNSGLLYKL